MRIALIAAFIGLAGLGATVGEVRAEAVKVSPQMTVFTRGEAPVAGSAPTILRGSATKRGTVHYRSDRSAAPEPVLIGAGSTVWFGDPATGEIIACEPRRSSRVGSRFVDCFGGDRID